MRHLTMPHAAYRICALAVDGHGGRLAAVDDVGSVLMLLDSFTGWLRARASSSAEHTGRGCASGR
jgi:hypothetical protein